MSKVMMPLGEAIGRLADMHEAERDRLAAWLHETAPKVAAEHGLPVEKVKPVLEHYLAQHIATLGELSLMNADELVMKAMPH